MAGLSQNLGTLCRATAAFSADGQRRLASGNLARPSFEVGQRGMRGSIDMRGNAVLGTSNVDQVEPTRIGREGGYGFDLSRIREDDGEREKMFAAMRSLSNAGVVADSVPELENKECWNKARALLAAIEPARVMARDRRARS